MGWTFPWASSFANDFNADFKISFTEEQQRDGTIEYNYHREAAWQMRSGEGMATQMEGTPVGDNAARLNGCGHIHSRTAGHECVRIRDGVVYHTYSAFARGLDAMWALSVARPPRPRVARIGRRVGAST